MIILNNEDKIIEIVPRNNINVPETLIINIKERVITNIHTRDPRNGNATLTYLLKRMPVIPQCMVLEISTIPNSNCKTSKTLRDELLYFDPVDLNSDMNTLKGLMIKGNQNNNKSW